MAKKKEKKKAVKKAKTAKPVKKASVAAKKAAKPAAKNGSKSKPVKAAKQAKPVVAKKADNKKKESTKELKTITKSKGKPIDAIAKKDGKPKQAAKVKGTKGAREAEEEEEADVEDKDDYEKSEEEESTIEPGMDEPIMDLEVPPASDVDDDEDEIPEKRGRGRRKKNEGKSTGGTMEAYIRNRPLQIDISKPLVKKGGAPAPKPFINTEDNRTRYSDKELAEFKELILEKLREAQADYELLKQTLSNEDNHGTDDTSPSFKLLEDGSDVMSKEETAQLASRQEKYIVSLKNALVRIENKAYGICRVTGKLIPKERLRSVPHATLGIDAKLNQS